MDRPARLGKEDLYRRLQQWRLDGGAEENRAVSESLWRELGTERTVLITDLSGFTRITRSHGLLQFLAVFERARAIGEAAIARHGGRFLKADADNLFALFDGTGAAAACARELLAEAARLNAAAPDPAGHVRFCIGIACGRVLELSDDAFGDPVNLAFKLGEDVAEAGEILLTAEAAEALRAAGRPELAAALRGPELIEVGHVPVSYFKLPPG